MQRVFRRKQKRKQGRLVVRSENSTKRAFLKCSNQLNQTMSIQSANSIGSSSTYTEHPRTFSQMHSDMFIDIADERNSVDCQKMNRHEKESSESGINSSDYIRKDPKLEHTASDILADLNETSLEKILAFIAGLTASEDKSSILPSIQSENYDNGLMEATNIETMKEDGDHPISKYTWFPGLVSLSILESCQENSFERAGSWGKFFVTSNQRAVRESCSRHLQFYRNSSLRGSRVQSTLVEADEIVRRLVDSGDYNSAIAAAEELLLNMNTKQSGYLLTASSVARQLALLCLAIGRTREANRYSVMAVKILPYAENLTHEHATSAVLAWVEYGLVSFGTNKIGRALKAWRAATNMAIDLNGYQNRIVAVLLNYIGVWHLVSGNVNNSRRSFEASCNLQRHLLSEAANYGSVESAVFSLAMTMGNLALAYERSGQSLQAIALLEESIGLYESTLIESEDLQDISRTKLKSLIEDHEREKFSSEDFATVAEDESNDIPSDKNLLQRNLSLNKANIRTEEHSLRRSISDRVKAGIESTCSTKSMSLLGRDQADNHDFLLLGSLLRESTTEERVRDAVLAWFGWIHENPRFLPNEEKFCGEGSLNDIPRTIHLEATVDPVSSKIKQSIPADFNDENELDAGLRNREIHDQAMIHIDNHEYEDMKRYRNIHHLIGRAHDNIGTIYLVAKKYDLALKAFEKAVNVRQQVLGPLHPDVQRSKIKIALIHMAQGDLLLAYDGFWDIRNELRKSFGPMHPQVAKINNNIGVIAYEFRDLVTAQRAFKIAHKNLQHLLELKDDTDESVEITTLANAHTLCNLAFVLSKADRREKALKTYELALTLLQKYLPNNHHYVLEVQENVKSLMQDDSSGCDVIRCADEDEFTFENQRAWCTSKRICDVDIC